VGWAAAGAAVGCAGAAGAGAAGAAQADSRTSTNRTLIKASDFFMVNLLLTEFE